MKAAADLRGTPQQPLIIKNLDAPKDTARAEEERREQQTKRDNERALVLWTIVLASATALLALVAVGQFWMFLRQLRLMREGAEDTKTLANAARVNAEAAQSSVDTARKALVSTHRPRIRVRNIVIKQPKPLHTAPLPLFARGHPVSGQFYIDNVGGTRAYVLEAHCDVFWSDKGLPMERPYEGKRPNILISETWELQAGEPKTVLFESEQPLDTHAEDIASGNFNWKIYVMGWIDYGDDVGIRRRTTFCREYRLGPGGQQGRFHPVDDADYEQED